MKKMIYVLGFLLLIVLAFVATSNFWLQGAIAQVIYRVTGFPLTIEKARLNLLGSRFGIYGIEMNNPKGFREGRFASIPELYVEFDLPRFILKRKFYFQEIRLHIDEVAIVRNPSGGTNLAQLGTLAKRKNEMKQERNRAMRTPSPDGLDFFINRLVLTIRHVRYQDDTKLPPVERSVDLHVDHELFLGIANPSDIVRIIVLRIVHRAAIGNLGVPAAQLKEHLDAALVRGGELTLQSTALAREMGVGALGEGRRLVERVSETVTVPQAGVGEIKEEVQQKAKNIFRSAGTLFKYAAESGDEKT